MPFCGWFSRHKHARLREIDQRCMLATLLQEPSRPRRLLAWEWFIAAPGQEHWRCPCAAKDRQVATRHL